MLSNFETMASTVQQLAGTIANKTIYYMQVSKHVCMRVYEQERMSPPSSAELDASIRAMREVATSTMTMARQKKMPSMDTLKLGGRVGLELLGWYTVGEMIGRWHVVGYKQHPSATY